MERVKTLLTEANELLKRADHLASVTYNLVNETKLLMVIAETIHSATIKAMDALLYYDFLYKRVTAFPTDVKERVRLFKVSSAKRYNFPRDAVLLISELQELIEKRKASAVEFVRHDKFVIASDEYKLRSLDIKKVKNYVERTKMFINKVNLLFKPRDRRSSHI